MPRVWAATAREEVNAAALQDRFASALGLGSVGKKGATRLPSDVHVRRLRGSAGEPGERALNLAQCVGLEEKPPPPLSRAQWRAVAKRSRARAGDGGVADTCAICLQEFRAEEQLLLSCSHVFHRACLRSFERVSGRNGACCPLCRSTNYEKRKLHDGRERWREMCAIRIQAHVRGHLARRRVAAMRALMPPRDPDDRRRYYAKKLEDMNDGLIRGMEAERANVDSLFRELDASLSMSRTLSSRVVGRQHPVSPSSSSPSAAPVPRSSACDVVWEEVLRVANRNFSENDCCCPICIGPLYRGPRSIDEGGSCVALLSCGHCFHIDCIDTFEEFLSKQDDGGTHRQRVSLCPCCRTPYVRKTIHASSEQLALLS